MFQKNIDVFHKILNVGKFYWKFNNELIFKLNKLYLYLYRFIAYFLSYSSINFHKMKLEKNTSFRKYSPFYRAL